MAELSSVWGVYDPFWNGPLICSRNDQHFSNGGNSCRGGGEKRFLIMVSVLGHLKVVGKVTSNFLRGGDMDVFRNDPLPILV